MPNKDDEDLKDLNLDQNDNSQTLNDLLYGYNNKMAPAPTQSGPAAARGALQGASLGFADEGIGAGQALFDKATGSDKALIDLYAKYRDQSRANNVKAQQEHPAAYGAGNLVGGLATSALLPGSMAGLVGQGAAMGLGNSNANNIKDLAKDTATGAATGYVIGAGGKGLAKLGEYLKGMPDAVREGSYAQPTKTNAATRDTVLDPNRDNGSIGIADTMPAPKPELELRDNTGVEPDLDKVDPKKQAVADRVSAFRKRQEVGLGSKSDKLAEEMFGIKPNEPAYNPKIDDITVPEDKRQDFGALSGLPPGTKWNDAHKLQMGYGKIPKQSNVPEDLGDYLIPDHNGDSLGLKMPLERLSSQPPLPSGPNSPEFNSMNSTLVDVLNSQPQALGKYAGVLTKAAQQGPKVLAITQMALNNNDPEFRKLMKSLNK